MWVSTKQMDFSLRYFLNHFPTINLVCKINGSRDLKRGIYILNTKLDFPYIFYLHNSGLTDEKVKNTF